MKLRSRDRNLLIEFHLVNDNTNLCQLSQSRKNHKLFFIIHVFMYDIYVPLWPSRWFKAQNQWKFIQFSSVFFSNEFSCISQIASETKWNEKERRKIHLNIFLSSKYRIRSTKSWASANGIAHSINNIMPCITIRNTRLICYFFGFVLSLSLFHYCLHALVRSMYNVPISFDSWMCLLTHFVFPFCISRVFSVFSIQYTFRIEHSINSTTATT